MRDKKRIPETLDLINKIWSKYPDLRFFQLLDYLVHEYAKDKQISSVDVFNLEDTNFIEFLKSYIENHNIE